jgi:Tfp pilus assembly protein FimT
MVRTKRRRAFTLIELVVSFSILMIAFVLVAPAYNRMRSDQMNNAVAQELANDLRRLSAEALQGETYTVLTFDSNQKWTMKKVRSSYNNNWSFTPSTWQTIKSRDFSMEMGRTQMSTTNTQIGFGPKGWTTTNSDNSAVQCSSTLTQGTDSLGAYYQITCSAGGNIPTYSVRVYKTGGRVNVVTP